MERVGRWPRRVAPAAGCEAWCRRSRRVVRPGQDVGVRAGQPGDQAFHPESPQVVTHLTHGVGHAEQGGHPGAQLRLVNPATTCSPAHNAPTRAMTRGSPNRRAGALRPSSRVGRAARSKMLMALAGRSRVDETVGASPADVVLPWCGLSPTQRLTLEPVPVGYSGLPPSERESQTLDLHAGSAVDAPIGSAEGSQLWRSCMNGSPR